MLSFKKSYDKYGNYMVYLVDEQEVRNLSLNLEEFTNYAIHSDFPRVIPKNEIWLSRHVSGEEMFILIDEALYRLKYELRGMSSDEAYEIALKHDKSVRHKILHSKHINVPTKNEPHESIYINHYGTFKNIEIYIVDGNLVRNFFKTDFVEGGHDYVYHFVPWGEVWIDVEIPEEERILIVIHELAERELMRDKHLPYEKAHEKASKIEWRFRSKLK